MTKIFSQKLLVVSIVALGALFVGGCTINLSSDDIIGYIPELNLSAFAKCKSSSGAILAKSGLTESCALDSEQYLNLSSGLPKENAMIKLQSPLENATVTCPIELKGEAKGSWFFEASFPVEFADPTGKVVGWGLATADSEWMTDQFVPFSATIECGEVSGPITMILRKDNPSGLPENEDAVYIPMKIGADAVAPAKTTVKVFFGNKKIDEDVLFCEKTYATDRIIDSTPAVGMAALEQLLAGPNDKEIAAGFFTSIEPGVKIKSLKIEKGVAYVDFDSSLEKNVGGSCRVSTIRSQITETLKQFPTVTSVEISIDGRKEYILQP